MKKKIKLNNIIPHILAAVTVITIIIACGEGDIVNVNTDAKTKREIELANYELINGKIDSLTHERTSSAVELPSSGLEPGESSSSDSTTYVSSSGTVDVSSSSITEISSSSSGGVLPSSSSENPYELKCEKKGNTNIIFSESKTKFDFDNDSEYGQIPAVKCVIKGSTEGVSLTPENVEWSHSKGAWRWDATNIGEQKISALSAYDEDCSKTPAICGDFILCFNGSNNHEIGCPSQSSSAAASSSSAEPSSSSSIPAEYDIKCTVQQTALVNSAVPIPTISCGPEKTASGAKFKYTGGSLISTTIPSWDSLKAHIFRSAGDRKVYMHSISCDGTPLSLGTPPPTSGDGKEDGVLCGTIKVTQASSSSAGTTTSSSSGSVSRTITCVFGANSYTVNVAVPAPTIICSPNGALSLTNATFTATPLSPPDIANWKTTSGTATYSSIGTSTVKVSGVYCGSQSIPETTCTPNPITIAAAPVTYTLLCGTVPPAGTVGVGITPPSVTCNGTAVTPTGWAGTPSAPDWASPAEGTYSSIIATADCGGSKTANCTGSLIVSAAAQPSSSSAAVTYTATCDWAGKNTTMYTEQARPLDPTITCTPTVAGSVSSGLPPAGNLATAATYTPSGIKCGTETPTNSVSCGTLTVKTTPIVACAGTANETVTLPAKPTKPTITLTDPSNICSANSSTTPNSSWTSESWTVKKDNSTNLTGAWASIAWVAGTYNTYSVSGKCGDYATNLTANCSAGNATIVGCSDWAPAAADPVTPGCYKTTSSKICQLTCTSGNCSVTPVPTNCKSPTTSSNNGGNMDNCTFANATEYTFSGSIKIGSCW